MDDFKITIVNINPKTMFQIKSKMSIFKQRTKGIRQWPINVYTSSIMIHKITTAVDYN